MQGLQEYKKILRYIGKQVLRIYTYGVYEEGNKRSEVVVDYGDPQASKNRPYIKIHLIRNYLLYAL